MVDYTEIIDNLTMTKMLMDLGLSVQVISLFILLYFAYKMYKTNKELDNVYKRISEKE